MSTTANWWNVGEPTNMIAWCEENVEKACDALAEDITPWFEMGQVGDPFISLYFGLWEAEKTEFGGKRLLVSDMIARAVDDGQYNILEAIAAQIAEALSARR